MFRTFGTENPPWCREYARTTKFYLKRKSRMCFHAYIAEDATDTTEEILKVISSYESH